MKTSKISHWNKAGELLDATMKPPHTPTPWRVEDINGFKMVASGETFVADCSQFIQSDADAAFIVAAVNSHEEMLKALYYAKTILNSIAGNLKSDFNLAHDNMATNACAIAATCEKAIRKAEGR